MNVWVIKISDFESIFSWQLKLPLRIQNNFFKFFSTICVSSVENSLFSSVSHFDGINYFWWTGIFEFLNILDTNLSDIFYLFYKLPLWIILSFTVQKLCGFMGSCLLIFDLNVCAIKVLYQKILLWQWVQIYSFISLP